MQVFVPYPSPIDVAKCLDKRRLNKQIIEANQILDAVTGLKKGWRNHPAVLMYDHWKYWLWYYQYCLRKYREGDLEVAQEASDCADRNRPPFITQELCDQHKRRLYAKAPDLYPQFGVYGASEENWYFIDGRIVKYVDGKRI